MSTVGSTGAQEIMKRMRVGKFSSFDILLQLTKHTISDNYTHFMHLGQKLYIVGVPKRNPNNEHVLDIVTHSIRILEEVEIVRPRVVPKEWNLPQVGDVYGEVTSNWGNTSKKRMGVKKLESRYDITIPQLMNKSPSTKQETSEQNTEMTKEEKLSEMISYYAIDVNDGMYMYTINQLSRKKQYSYWNFDGFNVFIHSC